MAANGLKDYGDKLGKSVNQGLDKVNDSVNKRIDSLENKSNKDKTIKNPSIKDSIKNKAINVAQNTLPARTYRKINDFGNNLGNAIEDNVNFQKDNWQKAKENSKDKNGAVKKSAAIANATKDWGDFTAKQLNGKHKGLANFVKGASKVISFIIQHWILIAIIAGIIGIVIPLIEAGIGLSERIGSTPHYYCEYDADKSLQQTAVFKQYCGKGSGSSMDFEHLNGHYIVQDGSGPCTSVSTLNMFLRYFAENGVNLYDYLWQDDGQYLPEGTVVENNFTQQSTLRRIINGGSMEATSTDNVAKDPSQRPYGSIAFAAAHGKGNYNMANWGYFKSEDIFEDGSFESNTNNENWVWDLSMDNFGLGTCWYAEYATNNADYEITIQGVTLHTKREDYVSPDRLKELFKSPNVCDINAGIQLLYNRPDGSGHGILITGYDETTNTWTIVDSALGTEAGYEGPMDGSGHFVYQESEVSAMLNGTGSYIIKNICYCVPSGNKAVQ